MRRYLLRILAEHYPPELAYDWVRYRLSAMGAVRVELFNALAVSATLLALVVVIVMTAPRRPAISWPWLAFAGALAVFAIALPIGLHFLP